MPLRFDMCYIVIIQPLLFICNTNDDPLTGSAYLDLLIAKVEIKGTKRADGLSVMSTKCLKVPGIGVEPI